MAHAGTPTDLAKQPATSTTNGLWQTAAAAIVLLALVVGMVIVTSSLVASRASVAPAVDHRYDQIENLAANMRGGAAPARTTEDRSYDQIENQRGGVILNGLANDRSFDKIQSERGSVGLDKVVGHRGAMISE